jgi:small subunit ribosomal protein S18
VSDYMSEGYSGSRGRDDEGDGGSRGDASPFRRRSRRKVCRFCAEKLPDVDYKEVKLLGSFLTERGKIIPSRITGTCNRHQRRLCQAIKRARASALLPFTLQRR